LRKIRGEFIRTAKNGLVEDHFERLGFSPTEGSADGRFWELAVDDAWAPLPSYIQTTGEKSAASPKGSAAGEKS
jgi:hypothetical protein